MHHARRRQIGHGIIEHVLLDIRQLALQLHPGPPPLMVIAQDLQHDRTLDATTKLTTNPVN